MSGIPDRERRHQLQRRGHRTRTVTVREEFEPGYVVVAGYTEHTQEVYEVRERVIEEFGDADTGEVFDGDDSYRGYPLHKRSLKRRRQYLENIPGSYAWGDTPQAAATPIELR